MKSSASNQKPILLSPQDLLLSRLPGLLSLWESDRGNDAARTRTGQDIVAAWSGLQRLALPDPPGDRVQDLEQRIGDDLALLLDALFACRFDADSWRRRMEEIDAEWDRGEQEAEELEWRTQQLFEEFDRAELLAWFALKKAPSDPRLPAWLRPVQEGCEAAERFLAGRTDLFLCLATELAAVLAASRVGLETDDPQLWETFGKHRRIEEARDAVELPLPRDAILSRVPPCSSRKAAQTSGDDRRQPIAAAPERSPAVPAQTRSPRSRFAGRVVPAMAGAVLGVAATLAIVIPGSLLQPKDPTAALIQQLKEGSPENRKEAAMVLGGLGDRGKPAIPALEQALEDPSEEVQRAAAEALLRIDPRFENAIEKAPAFDYGGPSYG
jgi:hypothetical protein